MSETTRQKIRVHGGNAQLPPARPGVRHVRVPAVGIVVSDDDLRARIDRLFHWPMISLALLVLPLLAVDLWIKPEPRTAMWWGCVGAGAIIWLAFLVEFVIKVSVAECRIEYLKRNWLDVVIIVVPVLRPLRAAALARTSKVFTLRGVGMKFARYMVTVVIGLEATDRILERIGLKKKKVFRPDPSEMTRYALMDEVKRQRKLADSWERWYEAHREYLERAGVDLDVFELDMPVIEAPREPASPPDPATAAETALRPEP